MADDFNMDSAGGGNLFKDITRGLFHEVMPVAATTVDSGRDVMNEFRNLSRKLTGTMRQESRKVSKTYQGRQASAAFDSAMHDIATGTFDVSKVNNTMYDDYDDIEKSSSVDTLTADEKTAMSPEDIIARSQQGVSRAVIRSASAQMDAMMGTAQSVMGSNIAATKALGQQITNSILYNTNTINANLMVANGKLSQINANLETLIEYQNTNTTKFYEKNLEVMTAMGKMIANLESMDTGKQRRRTNMRARNGFDFREYVNRIKKGLKSSIFATGAQMVKTTAGMQTPGENIASLLSIFLPQRLTKPLKDLDSHLGQNFEEILKRIGDKASGNTLLQLLGIADALGNKRGKMPGAIGMHAYQKDMLPWNGKAQRALVEVIPELLTSIDAGINKTDKRYYDYETGKFNSRKSIEQAFDDEYFSRITFEMDSAISKISKAIESAGLTAAEKVTAKNRVSDIVHDRAFGNGDVIQSRQQMADILSQMNVSTTDFTSIMRDFEKSLETVTESMEDLYDKIGSTDSIYRVVNNDSGSTRRQPVGRSRAATLAERAKSQNIFSRSYIDQNINDSVDAIVSSLQAEFPEEDITGTIKRQIYSDLLNGANEEDALKRYRNQFNRGKGVGKLLDYVTSGGYSARRQAREAQRRANTDPRVSRFGDRVQQIDDEMFLRVHGIRYNGQGGRGPQPGPTPNPPPGAAGSRTNPQGGPQPPAPPIQSINPIPVVNGGTPQPRRQVRSTNALGDTTLQNKRASSQRSQMNGEEAGAEAAHRGGSSNQLITSVNNPQMDRALESLEGAVNIPFNNALNNSEAALNLNERNRAAVVGAISEIPPQSGGVMQAIKNMIDVSRVGMTTMLSSFTDFGARLFGKEGMIKSFFESDLVKKQFEKLKNKLFNEKDGIFKDQIAWLKSTGSEIWGNTKEELAKGYNWVYDKYFQYKYRDKETGEVDENYRDRDEWKNSKWAQRMDFGTRYLEKKKSSVHTPGEVEDGVAEVADEAIQLSETLKTSVNKVEESLAPLAEGETSEVLITSINKIEDAAQEGAEKIKSSLTAVADTVAGEEEKKSSTNKVKEINSSLVDAVKKGAPKVLAGGIAGLGLGALTAMSGPSLLTSMFLPGGPIGGAIVGSGIALLSQTEAFKSFMFGKKSEKTGERDGGLISKKMREGFKKAAPIAIGGAALSALKAIPKMALGGGGGLGVLGMQLLPGGILGGAILGMGIGLLKNSDLMQNTLFGKKKDGSPNALAKGYGKVKELFKGSGKAIMNGLKGAGIGVLTGTVLSNMGFLPAMLSLGGPVGMGVAGLGLGIASSTKHFNEWMFGTEELDENGEPTGKRKGGILNRVRNILTINVIDPITDSFRENMLEFIDWGKDKITMPFRTALGPILDSITGIKDNVVDYMKDKFDMIGEGIKSAFTSTIKTIFSPVTKLVGVIGKGAMNVMRIGTQAALAPVQMGLGALNLLTMGKRRKEYMQFYKQYYAKGNINKNLNEYWDAQEADGNKVGFLGRFADRMSAYMGRGPIADAAREGYNEEMEAAGKDHLKWRSVAGERRDLKEQRKQRRESFKKWQRIDKLRKSIGTKDLEGEEAELTPAMFERYRKKFVDLGIDESLLQNNDDLMQLIYHKSDFRKRAAGDSGQLGESMALKQFRTALQEEMKSDEQLKQAVETNQILDDIRDQFRELADRVLFDRQASGYMDERKEDNKRLQRKFKNLYKTGLWDKKTQGKINLNDPELLEYDISGIDNKMLREFAMSKFAENGDFKGFLESYGRKLSPNDIRTNYISGQRPGDRTTRTSSATNNATTASGGNPITEAINNLTESVREQTNINAAQLETQTGGEINADDVADRRGRSFGSRIMNKFSTAGVFGGWFKRKQKADKAKARSDREAAESADAQALGDEQAESDNPEVNVNVEGGSGEEEKKESLFSKILNGAKGLLGSFANTKVGGIITTALKVGGGIFGVAGLAIGIMEMIRPGTQQQLLNWTEEVTTSIENGNFYDDFIKPTLEKVMGKVVDGATYFADNFPDWFETKAIPRLEKTAEVIAANAESIVGIAATVIGAIGPPLADAFVKVVPTIAGSFMKAIYNATIAEWMHLPKLGDKDKAETVDFNQFPDIDDQQAFIDKLRSEGTASYTDKNGNTRNAVLAEGGEVSVDENGNVTWDRDTSRDAKFTDHMAGVVAGDAARAAIQAGKGGKFTSWLAKRAGNVFGALGGIVPGATIGGTAGLVKGPIGSAVGTVTGGVKGAMSGAKHGGGLFAKAGQWIANGPASGLFKNTVTTGTGLSNIPILGRLFGNSKAQQSMLTNLTNAAASGTVIDFDNLAKLTGEMGEDAASRQVIREAAEASLKNAMSASNTNMTREAMETAIQNATNKLITENGGNAVDAALNIATNGVKETAEAAASGAVDAGVKSAKKGVLQKFFTKVKEIIDNKILKNEKFTKIVSKFTADNTILGKFVKSFSGIVDKVMKKVFADERLWMKYATKAADMLAKMGLNVTPIAVLTVSYDLVNGAFSAKNIFNMHYEDDVDWLMRLIAALLNAVFGYFVPLDLILEIGGAVMGKDFKCQIASTLYKAMAPEDGGLGLIGDTALENSQIKQEIATEKYNAQHGTSLTAAELSDKTNPGMFGWVLNGGKWAINGVTNFVTGGHGTNFETVGSVRNAMSNVSDAEVAAYRSNLGHGPGDGKIRSVNYYSQTNPAWADQMIGRFPSGNPATMANAGCGPTAMALAVREMTGLPISPSDMGAYAASNGYITDGGANSRLFTEGARAFGLNAHEVSKSNLEASLRSSAPTIISGVSGESGPYTKAGHILVAKGLNRGGQAVVEDPYDGTRTTMPVSKLKAGYRTGYSYDGAIGYGSPRMDREMGRTRTTQNRPHGRAAHEGITTTPSTNNKVDAVSGAAPSTTISTPSLLTTIPTPGLKTISPEAATIISNAAGGTPAPGVGNGNLLKVYTDGKEYYVPAISGYKYDGASMSYINIDTGAAIPVMDVINHTAQISGFMWNSRSKQYESRQSYNGKKLTIKPSDFDPISQGLGPRNGAASIYNARQKTAAATPTNAGETTVVEELSAVEDAPGTIQNFLDDFTKGNGINKLLALGRVMEAWKNSILNGTDIWEEYKKLSSGSSASSGVTGNGDNVAPADLGNVSDQSQAIWMYLRQQGFSKEQAAGIMGCWQAESSNKSKRIEGDYLKGFPGYAALSSRSLIDNYVKNVLFPAYDRSNVKINKAGYKDSDGHYYPGIGLAQWTRGRTKNMMDYAQSYGKQWHDLGAQLGFFTKEMSNGYAKTNTKVRSASTISDATNKFLVGYEGISGGNGRLEKRIGYAKAIYEKYKGLDTTNGAVVTTAAGRTTTRSGVELSGYGPGDTEESEKMSFADISRNINDQVINPIYQKLFELTGINLSGGSATSSSLNEVSGAAENGLPGGGTEYATGTVDPSMVDLVKELPNTTATKWLSKVLKGRLTSPYGSRVHPITKKQSMHWGIDIGAAGGTPIYSTVNGTVNTNTFNDGGYGNYLSITAADGTRHYYAHMKSPAIPKKGATVVAGQKIGYVGTTGASTGNHLHYEIRKSDNTRISPDTYKYPTTIFNSGSAGYGIGDIGSLIQLHGAASRHSRNLASGALGYGKVNSKIAPLFKGKSKFLTDVEAAREFEKGQKNELKFSADGSRLIGYGSGPTDMTNTEGKLQALLEVVTQWYNDSKKATPPSTTTTNVIDASTRVVNSAQQKPTTKTEPAPVIGKIDSLVERHAKYASAY